MEHQHIKAEIHEQPGDARNAIEDEITAKGHVSNQTVSSASQKYAEVAQARGRDRLVLVHVDYTYP